MKRWSKLFPALVMIIAGSFYSQRLKAQCTLELKSAPHDCVPAISTFKRTNGSTKTVTNYFWDFGDGFTSSDTTTLVTHQYTTAGSYKVKITITYSDGSTCVATLAQFLKIYAPPKAVANLPFVAPFGATQCYKRGGVLNHFQFSESSIPGSSGATVVKYIWNFGDGDTSTLQNPTHTYQAPGTYDITLRVIDTNGCVGYDKKTSSIVVLKDIKTKFTLNGKLSCNSADFSFKNTTDTVGLNLKSFLWSFGDGTYDSVNYNISKHTYGPGTYYVKLTITNNLDCDASDSQKIVVDKFQIKAIFKDTICWADATSNGVRFVAAQQPNVVFWQWNFGDPNSQNLNIANYAWTATHKFVGGPPSSPWNTNGGPGNYKVRFLMVNSNPNCGKNGVLDTCFLVHIKGPMAMINLPPPPTFPPNNYYPVTLMPKFIFTDIINNPSSCGPQTIKYSVFSKAATATNHYTNHYCNADTTAITVDTLTDCFGGHKMPYVSSITLKPTSTTNRVYFDSTEVTKIWTKGIDAPPTADKKGYAMFGTQHVYYPSSGTLTWNTMHDSNMVTCTLPNLVRFTNNSVKYRLRLAMDDMTFSNVLTPAQSFMDTCRWKNYPMATDSMIYFWKFNDPTGKPCTSSVSNKDWNCNFSTLAAPYHYYKGPKVPVSRCQSVNFSVTDPISGCADSTVLQLKQGSPQAYWDQTAYCKMTWEMQVSGLAPKGTPGPNGPPLIGFILGNQSNACTGPVYPFRIDFSQTLPTCGAEHWWAVFDSANVVKYKKCKNPADSMIDYGFLGDPKLGYSPGKNGYPAGAPDKFWQGLPWLGNYWYEQGDSGCKTIGIVLQNGKCFDTAWYHNYICFNKLVPEFNIFQVTPKVGGKENFLDASIHFHGWVCQQGYSEGVNLRLYPYDTNQKDVTSFKYSIQRRQFWWDPNYANPSAQWYYDLPFWPDSAVLNPFSTWNDSIRQISYKIYYIDTPHLYINLTMPGLPTKRILLNFPLYKAEYDSLVARQHVNVYLTDERARRISAVCTKPYVTLFLDKVVAPKATTQVLNLNGFGAVDSLIIPYPGFYTIQSVATNLQGCLEPAQYHLVYGHYAIFDANNDSIVCLGQPVKFNYYVRYWSTNCPPPPGGGAPPDGCLNGSDDLAGLANNIDYAPWNFKGKAADYRTWPKEYRDSIFPKWATDPANNGYRNEEIWWNFGDNTIFNRVPTGSKITHTYTKPGVYTVSMRTIDRRGCPVTTVRRNLIKVIQPVVDFTLTNLKDSFKYCAPQSIQLVDKTKLLGASYVDKVLKNGVLVDSTFVVDSILTHTWTPGDGRTITKTSTDTVIFDYQKNGKYTVGLTVKTNHGCGDAKSKVNYITIKGPEPKFKPITPTSGCYPLTVVMRNINTPNVQLNVWHYGDDSLRYPNAKDSITKEDTTTQVQNTSPPTDSTVILKYTAKKGHFRVYVEQTDTFHDIFTGAKLPPCKTVWPAVGDSQQIWVTIFPNSPLKIHGPRVLCLNDPATFNVTSDYNEYKLFDWDFGDKITINNTKDSSETKTYTFADTTKRGKDPQGRYIYTIRVKATSDSGCKMTDTFNVHLDFTKAAFAVDSAASNLAQFTFNNKSIHGADFLWEFGDGQTKHTGNMEGFMHQYSNDTTINEGEALVKRYPVKLSSFSQPNMGGCRSDTTIWVQFLRQFQHYNVFTPNGDLFNNYFIPKIKGETFYELKIFNRWGQKVFESNSSTNNWDGTSNGVPCPEGAYYYIWHFKMSGGIDKTINGAVTLLRK
jgi:gliding motility-associated-like protein